MVWREKAEIPTEQCLLAPSTLRQPCILMSLNDRSLRIFLVLECIAAHSGCGNWIGCLSGNSARCYINSIIFTESVIKTILLKLKHVIFLSYWSLFEMKRNKSGQADMKPETHKVPQQHAGVSVLLFLYDCKLDHITVFMQNIQPSCQQIAGMLTQRHTPTPRTQVLPLFVSEVSRHPAVSLDWV